MKIIQFVLTFAIWAAGIGAASADISFVNMFRDNAFLQTGNGNSVVPTDSFFTLLLVSTDPNEFTAVASTYPGSGSPVVLAPTDSTTYTFQSGLYPTQAAMDAAFPTGNYAFTATDGSGTLSTNFDYLADSYPLTTPFLTGTNYADLQGMNANAPFAFQFSTYTPNPAADGSLLFLTIYDNAANAFVFNAGFLPPTTSGLTLSANTLLPNTPYTYELIFSDRVLAPSPGSTFDAQIGFDLRTTGTFTTVVPEPASAFLLAWGGMLMGWSVLGRKTRGSR